jgi:hypothetical protein
MEQSYHTNKKYNGQRVSNTDSFHFASQYRQTKSTLKYIVKNFNNKNIRFAIRSEIEQGYVISTFGDTREWTLLLALTPILPDNRIPKYISSKKYESFSYTILSSKKNSGDQVDGYINLPAINDGYSKYFVDVKLINVTTLEINSGVEYLSLYAYDWAENGYGGLSSDKMLIGLAADQTLSTPFFPPNASADNSVFVIKKMGVPRQIRFKWFKYYGQPVLSSQITTKFRYSINCLITPIE